MYMKIRKIIKYIIILGITFLLFIFLVVFGPEIYYDIKGFQYVEPQPNYLVTLKEHDPDDHFLRIRLEADIIAGCLPIYQLRTSSMKNNDEVWIQIDGLYKKWSMSCRGRGPYRPEAYFDIGKVEEDQQVNLVFTLEEEDRLNKYILTRKDNKIGIEPKDGGFTTIIAYEKGIFGTTATESYSEKYDWRKLRRIKEEFQGKAYLSY